MNQPVEDGHEPRIRSFEHQTAELRQRLSAVGNDAGAARVLAAGADREVADVRSELRAHIRVLNALRETQVEQGVEMRERFARLESEMREGFAVLGIGMAQITALLTGHSDEG